MTVTYEAVDLKEVLEHLTVLAPKTVVFDVEPLVAFWDTDQASLVRGVETVLAHITTDTVGVEMVVFATNSSRRLPADVAGAHPRMRYLADAAKPLRTAQFGDCPRPGAVVGDQIATDGVLARRLGYAFVHYRPALDGVPLGPRLMNQVGRPLRSMLFNRGR